MLAHPNFPVSYFLYTLSLTVELSPQPILFPSVSLLGHLPLSSIINPPLSFFFVSRGFFPRCEFPCLGAFHSRPTVPFVCRQNPSLIFGMHLETPFKPISLLLPPSFSSLFAIHFFRSLLPICPQLLLKFFLLCCSFSLFFFTWLSHESPLVPIWDNSCAPRWGGPPPTTPFQKKCLLAREVRSVVDFPTVTKPPCPRLAVDMGTDLFF